MYSQYFICLIVVLCFLLGDFSFGIIYSDFVVLVLAINMISNRFLVGAEVFLSFLIIIFGIIVGIISVGLGINSYLLSFGLIGRALIFFIVFYSVRKMSIEQVTLIVWALFFSCTISILYSVYNSYIGNIAYYGYFQIFSTFAPGISGFYFVVGGFTLCLSAMCLPFTSFHRILVAVAGLLSIVSGFLTIGLTAIVAGGIALSVLFLLAVWFYDISILSIMLFLLVCFFILIISLNLDLGKIFWRFDFFEEKLLYRLEKVDGNFGRMCESVWCKVFGIGPGAHSFLDGASIGSGSVLTFDQLHGRIFLEWGAIGSILWFAFFAVIFLKIQNTYKPLLLGFYFVSFSFSYGYEFIFESLSGSIFGVCFGVVCSLAKSPSFMLTGRN